MFNQIAINRFFHLLDGMKFGHLTLTTPEGEVREFGDDHENLKADIQLKSWSVISHLLIKGDIGFAEDYRDGLWESSNLIRLTELALKNQSVLQSTIGGNKIFRLISQLGYFLKSNTLKGSKKNIEAHYDLGNDFYELWLDKGMTYSSAIFTDDELNQPNNNLILAQDKKYQRIVDNLSSNSGKILEIGCGWGGFAEKAIQSGDYALKGVTLSNEQHAYAKQRLNKNADIVIEDYRKQTGLYDHIVSIEMFEAVGEKYWATYMRKIKELLSKKGKAVIQTITIDEPIFERYRKGSDFIRSYIFPGGMLPTKTRFAQEANKQGLAAEKMFSFGLSYGKTLEMWLENFDRQKNAVRNLGYDEGFIRLWRFYLAACAAGFYVQNTDVIHVELSHA